MNIKTATLICLSFMTIAFLHSCKDDEGSPNLAVAFTADNQEITAGGKVIFKDISTGDPSRWSWQFEGGTPAASFLNSPEVVYETPGNYSVKLVVSRGGDSTSITREAFIVVGYPEVTSDFSADKTSAVQGETVTFTDLSTGYPTAWAWEFTPSGGQTITSTEKDPVIIFTEPGIYTVKLTTSNPTGSDEEIKTDYLEVIDLTAVSADFSASTQSTYTDAIVNFTDASLGTANAWSWTFEGGTPATSTDQNPVVTYSAPGRYKVTLEAANDVKSSTKEMDNYILVVPGDNLAAFFPFNGNANDAGPNSLPNSINGTVTFDGTDRNAASAHTAVFTGAGGILVPDAPALNFGIVDYSVSFWVKTDRTNRMMIWQESGDKGSADNQTWCRLGANTTTQLTAFNTEDAAGGSFLGMSEAEKGKMYDNVWHHVVCVKEGLVTKVYVDGVKAKEVTSTKGVKDVSNNGPFKIGMQSGTAGYSNYFNGALDDMIIYTKALSDQEVADLFGL